MASALNTAFEPSANISRFPLTRTRRQEIANQIEMLIDLLDTYDGDCDMEDDDPAGGAVEDVGEVDESRPDGIVLQYPRYETDQSLGPVNEVAVFRQFKSDQLARYAA